MARVYTESEINHMKNAVFISVVMDNGEKIAVGDVLESYLMLLGNAKASSEKLARHQKIFMEAAGAMRIWFGRLQRDFPQIASGLGKLVVSIESEAKKI